MNANSIVSVEGWVLLALFAAATFFFLITGAILRFHWRRYGMRTRVITRAEKAYFAVGGALVAVAALLLAAR